MYVEEVGRLVNELDISAEHATEIINVFFECLVEDIGYKEYLRTKVKRFSTEDLIASGYIEDLKDEMDKEGIAYWVGDTYVLTTQYDELQRLGLVS